MRALPVLNGVLAGMIIIVLTGIWLLPPDHQLLTHVPVVTTEERAPSQQPLRLLIPAHGIDAPVERVGLTPLGNMDIPQSAFTVGWYEHGTVPGAMGNAVLAGHLDTALGTPGIFWALKDVQLGEIIVVETDGGPQSFRVIRTKEFPVDRAPMQDIFGAANGRYLNLITCAGQWNQVTYDKRLVIFAEWVQPEGKSLSVL